MLVGYVRYIRQGIFVRCVHLLYKTLHLGQGRHVRRIRHLRQVRHFRQVRHLR